MDYKSRQSPKPCNRGLQFNMVIQERKAWSYLHDKSCRVKKDFMKFNYFLINPSKTSAVFETSSELDSFHNFGFSLSIRLLVKKTRLSSISTVYEKRILLINYPECFIKEFIVLLLFFLLGNKKQHWWKSGSSHVSWSNGQKIGRNSNTGLWLI